MKKQILTLLALMIAIVCTAGEIRTLRVTTEPPMTCNNCENRIKKTIRFEKGVREIHTDRVHQVVTVVYDAAKTKVNKIIEAFGKMKYRATVLDDTAKDGNDKSPAEKK